MQRIAELTPGILTWSRPHFFRRQYELRMGDQPADGPESVAALRWSKNPGIGGMLLRRTAVAESGDGTWYFERFGLFLRHTHVRQGEDTSDMATFRSLSFGHARLEYPGHGQYDWRRTRFLPLEWTFFGDSDTPLVRFRSGLFSQGRKGKIEITDNATMSRNELPLLVLLGWHRVILLQRRRRS